MQKLSIYYMTNTCTKITLLLDSRRDIEIREGEPANSLMLETLNPRCTKSDAKDPSQVPISQKWEVGSVSFRKTARCGSPL